MTNFKVKNKHLTGKIKDFPKHIVQLMVDEQVNQGNLPNPQVFVYDPYASQLTGGFTWADSKLGHDTWIDVITRNRFDLIPKPKEPKGHVHAKLMRKYAKDAMTNEEPWELWEMRGAESEPWLPMLANPRWCANIEYRRKSEAVAAPAPVAPNEIIKAMLDKDMIVWACISDVSYDNARTNLDKRVQRIVGVNNTDYPMRTASNGWRFAVPVNTATMTEITELP